MLNRLRNNEIVPYFWECRARTLKEATFTFLDLDSLKAELRRGDTHLSSDAVLETVLYGTAADPHFSGWTLGRLKDVLRASGFGEPTLVTKNLSVTTAVAPIADWSPPAAAQARGERRRQKIWAFRKGLRAKAGLLKARVHLLWRGPDLNIENIYLNLGAGGENYEGYIKVDLAGAQDIYDNIVTLSKISDASVVRIYCNHVLEHIPPALVAPLLRRWYEVLKPGGTVLARMPDARRSVLCLHETWEEVSDDAMKSFDLPNYMAREPVRTGKLSDDACIQMIYGWSNATPHSWDLSNQHKSLWTPGLARKRFEDAGFEVRTAEHFGTLNTLVVAQR